MANESVGQGHNASLLVLRFWVLENTNKNAIKMLVSGATPLDSL
jgi:hypothetical protein